MSDSREDIRQAQADSEDEGGDWLTGMSPEAGGIDLSADFLRCVCREYGAVEEGQIHTRCPLTVEEHEELTTR